MTEEKNKEPEKKNKIVMVTGCSSGFGIKISARLASKGYQVISTLRNLYRQDELLNAVKERGGEVTVMPLDVNALYTIDDCISQIRHKFGRIDVLVNNAGYGIGGFFEDLTDEEIRRQMDTNFFGVQNVTRRVLPLMREQKEGKIINISSVSGFSSQPAFSAYSASKWALEAFSESLHYEVEPFGIKVLLIEPGTYKT
ncbi:MAG: SDR family oxidoreductase, partial [Candidatus Omnitrophica bacterium]|nr:SDR family oxidoreductase [Candidatus Omnitrophota bacterium]